MSQLRDMVANSEKLCTRLADDALCAIEAHERKFGDYSRENAVAVEHLQRRLQEVHEQLVVGKEASERAIMDAVEKRVSNNVNEQISKISELLRKVVVNQRALQQKVVATSGTGEYYCFWVLLV